MPFTIGSVVFWKDGFPFDLSGQPRIDMMRLAYQKKLPKGVELRGDWYHHNQKLTWDDVNWDTAGERVTGYRWVFDEATKTLRKETVSP